MTEKLLKRYSLLVDFLGKALGPDYEVTLHDLDPKNSSIVAIANGRVSGRTLGSPLTKTTQEMLARKQYEENDYLLNYTGQLASGKTIRSSTMFIKDDSGKPVALLCINFDDSRFQEISDSLIKLIHPSDFAREQFFPSLGNAHKKSAPASPSAEHQAENFHNDVPSLMKALFDEVAAAITIPLDHLTQEEKTQFIAQLNDRGLFRFKGAVQYTTERLSCSQASIYRYLSKVKNR